MPAKACLPLTGGDAIHTHTHTHLSKPLLIHMTFCVITLNIVKKKNPMPRTLRSSLISLSQLPCPHNLPRILLCTSRIFELASSPYSSRGFLTSGINLPCLFRTKEDLPSLCTLYLYPKHIYVCLNAHRRVKDGSPTRSDRPPTPPACEHFPAADRNVSLTQIC